MNTTQIMQIFTDTAYVRMGGSPEEKKCAEYLKKQCLTYCKDVSIVPFEANFK